LSDSHGAHRDLHSSPTRRSSDLAGVGEHPVAQRQPERRGERPGAADLQLERTGPAVEGLGQLVEVLAPPGGGALGVAAGAVDEPDRKSTRLNSSHVKISYAVFCL